MHGAAYKNLPGSGISGGERARRSTSGTAENSHGWTPLTIAEGHRFGNFKPSPDTVDALRRVMTAAGITPVESNLAGTGKNSDYAKKP